MASDDPKRLTKKMMVAMAGVVQALTLETTAILIETTPVDTGWARANWVPSVRDPFEEVTGDPESPNPIQQERGIAEVATDYFLDDGPTFVTNNVPYIEALNDGHSGQAPNGFVEFALDLAVTRVGRRGSL